MNKKWPGKFIGCDELRISNAEKNKNILCTKINDECGKRYVLLWAEVGFNTFLTNESDIQTLRNQVKNFPSDTVEREG